MTYPPIRDYVSNFIKEKDPNKYSEKYVDDIMNNYGNNNKKLLQDMHGKYKVDTSDKYVDSIVSKYTVDPVSTSKLDMSGFNDYLWTLESKGKGDYKAANPTTTARGKYQHMWSIHGPEITKLTGVDSIPDYLNNTKAQETYQSKLNNQYQKHLPNLRAIAEKRGLELSDYELMYVEHHHGYGGAMDYLSGKGYTESADKELNKAILRGRDKYKGPNNIVPVQPIEQKGPTRLEFEQEAAKLAKEIDANKRKNTGPGTSFLSTFASNVWENGLYDAVTGTTDTEDDIKEAKVKLLAQNPKYNSLVNSKEDLQNILDGDYESRKRFDLRAAQKIDAAIESDAKSNWGQGVLGKVAETAFGGYDVIKNEAGENLFNLNPFTDATFNAGRSSNSLPEFVAKDTYDKLSTKDKDLYLTPDIIMGLKEHPYVKEYGSKLTIGQKRTLNQYLIDVQGEISKSSRIRQKYETSENNDYVKFLSEDIKGISKEITAKYGDIEKINENDPRLAEILADPLLQTYNKRVGDYNKAISDFEKETPGKKYAELYYSNLNAISKDYDNDLKSLDNSATRSMLHKLGRDIELIPNKLGYAVKGTIQLGGLAIDSVTGSESTASGSVSDAYRSENLRGSNESFSFLGQSNKTKEGVYAEYDDKGEIKAFRDDHGYMITDDPNSVQFNDLKDEEEKINPTKETNPSYMNMGFSSLFEMTLDGLTDMAPIMASGAILSKGLKYGTTLALSKNAAKTANFLSKAADSNRLMTFAGVFPGFSKKLMDDVVVNGGVDSSFDILGATALKLSTEGIIEMINPIEGKIITGNLFSKLNASQIRNLVNLSSKMSTKALLGKMVKYAGMTLSEIGINGVAEGAEEMLADIIEPSINQNLNSVLRTKFDTTFSAHQMLEAGAVGAMTGLVMSAGPSIISNAQNNNAHTLRASLQNPELFNKLFDGIYAEEQANIANDKSTDEVKKAKSDELTSKYETAKKVFAEATETSKKVFRETDGFVPSKSFQMVYSQKAFYRALHNNKDLDTDMAKAINSRVISNIDRNLSELDVLLTHKFDVPVFISDLNLDGKKKILDTKEYSNNYDKIFEKFNEAVEDISSRKNISEALKVDLLSKTIKSELNNIAKELDVKKEEAAKKAEEAKKEAEAKATQVAKEVEEINKKNEAAQLERNVISDVINDPNLNVNDLAVKYNKSEKEVGDILKEKDRIISDINKSIGNTIFSEASKTIKGIGAENMTAKDVNEIAGQIEKLVNESKFIAPDDKQDFIQKIKSKLNDLYGDSIKEALNKEQTEFNRDIFITKLNEGLLETLDTPHGQFAKEEDGTWKHADDTSKKIGTEVDDKMKNYLDSFGTQSYLYDYKGKSYEYRDGNWYSVETGKKITNRKGIDAAYMRDNPNQTILNFDPNNTSEKSETDATNPIQDPIIEPTVEKTVEKQIKQRINDALYDAYIDPSLGNDVIEETQEFIDYLVDNVMSHGYNEEDAKTLVEDKLQSRKTESARKISWLKSLADKNDLKTPEEFDNFLKNSTSTTFDLDLDLVRMFMDSGDATIVNNKVVIKNQSKIGNLPFRLVITANNGQQYYTYLHNTDYYASKSKYEGTPEKSAVDKNLNILLYAVDNINELFGTNFTLDQINDIIVNKKINDLKNEDLKDFLDGIQAEYYVQLFDGRVVRNINTDDFANIINLIKTDLYNAYSLDVLDTFNVSLETLSDGQLDKNKEGELIKTDELSKSDRAKLSPFIMTDSGKIVRIFKLPNNREASITSRIDPITSELRSYIYSQIANHLFSNTKQKTVSGKDIRSREIVRFFVNDATNLDYYVKLLKGEVIVKLPGKDPVSFTESTSTLLEYLDAYFDKAKAPVIKRRLVNSDIFHDTEKGNILISDVKIEYNGKVLFDGPSLGNYQNYIDSVSGIPFNSLNTFQHNLLFRPVTNIESSIYKNADSTTEMKTEVEEQDNNLFNDDLDITPDVGTRPGDVPIQDSPNRRTRRNRNIDYSFSRFKRKVSRQVIEKDLSWLSKVLPQIPTLEVDLGDIAGNDNALGAFVTALEILDDFGATHGIYYTNYTTTNSNRSQIRHEAFEAVWALYVKDSDKAKLLAEAKKIFTAPTKQELKEISDLYNIKGQEAIDKYYKEQLADSFNNYEYVESTNIINRFFNALKDLINYFLGNRNLITKLFDNIEKGNFKNKKQLNVPTNLKEYSSDKPNIITEARVLKIAKSLSRLLFHAVDTNGKPLFFDFTKINSKNLSSALNIDPKVLSDYYYDLTTDYYNTLENDEEKESFDIVSNSIADNILNKGYIYEEIIEQINSLYKTEVKTTEDEFDEQLEDDSYDVDGQFNMASYEHNYKANQYPIIRALLSSIVKKDNLSIAINNDTFLPDVIPYDKISNTLLRYLANKYTGAADINQILDDIAKLSNYRPEFSFLYKKLSEWNKDPKNKYLVHQFTTSVIHEKLNFSNVLVRNNGEVVVQDISKDSVDLLVSNWEQSLTDSLDTTLTNEVLESLIDKITIAKSGNLSRKSYSKIDTLPIVTIFKALGIKLHLNAVDYFINEVSTEQDKSKALDNLYDSLLLLVKDDFNSDKSLSLYDYLNNKERFETKDGHSFKINESLVKSLANAQLFFDDSLFESVIIVANKKVWLYALPSFLQQQLVKLKNINKLNDLKNRVYHRRSVLLKAMSDPNYTPSINDLNVLTTAEDKVDLNNSRLIEDQFASLIAHNNGKNNKKPFARLLSFNSHKRNNIFITLPKHYSFYDSTNENINSEVVDIVKGYLLDEFERYLHVKNNPTSFKNISKNYKKNYIFSQLSHPDANVELSKEPTIKAIEEKLIKYFYNLEGSVINENDIPSDIKSSLNNYVKHRLDSLVREEITYYTDLFDSNPAQFFPKKYLDETPFYQIIANNTINSIIGGVETFKVFMGDPSQYKDLTDITKRTHSLTSSGIYFETEYPLNYAVVKTDSGPSSTYTEEYNNDILFDIRKREFENHVKEGNLDVMPSDDFIKKQVATVDYSKVDKTDAAAEMTLPFWKEMLSNIGRWNPTIHDPIYDELLKGTATNESVINLLTTLQPVKTVGFDLNLNLDDSLAVATYLKWSQYVLHPASVGENTERQKRYNIAVYGKEQVDYNVDTPLKIEDQLHFYQYDSSSKGSNDASKYISNETSIDEVTKSRQTIESLALKIQQDLSSKSVKKTEYDEPSQTRKNIIQNILYATIYPSIDEFNSPKLGIQIVDEISKIDVEITLNKLEGLINSLGYDDGRLLNKENLASMLLDEFNRRSVSEDLINYIKNGNIDINKIPQFKGLIENKLSSIVRSKVIKSKLFGNAFIQAPEIGLTTDLLKSASKNISDNIKGDKLVLLDNFYFENDALKLRGPSMTKEGVYKPSLVFLPHSFVQKLSKENRTVENIRKIFAENPKLLKGVASRIPNQGGPSIDSFEIAGILPSYMGDSMVVYEDITQKYGSDYDIDKMYVSMYAYTVNNGKPFVYQYYENPSIQQSKELYDEFIKGSLNSDPKYKELRTQLAQLVKGLKNVRGKLEDAKLSRAIYNLKTVMSNFTGTEFNSSDIEDILNDINIAYDDNALILSSIRDINKILRDIEQNIAAKTPFSDFVKLPVEKQHSIKHLKNRKMDLYRQVLESEHYHFQNISPLDNAKDSIRGSIHDVYGKDPVNYRSDLGFYTSTEQTKIKSINVLSKASLGLAANSGVGLVKSRRAGMYYNLPLNGDFLDFTEIFNDKLNNPDYISTIIAGGYLSAFVDAEKDPYIIFGNINKFSFPIVDTLVKAGYTAKEIINFMTQPAIMKIFKNQKYESSLFEGTYKKSLTAIELAADEYLSQGKDLKGVTDFRDIKKLANKYLKSQNPKYTENLINYLKTGKETLTPEQSIEILYLFNQLKNHSKVIANTIISVKHDVNGSGATLSEAFASYEMVRDSLNISVNGMDIFVDALRDGTVDDSLIEKINKQSPVKNYVLQFVNKVNGTYKITSDGAYFLSSAVFLRSIMSKDSITQHPNVFNAIYDISREMGNWFVTNADIIRKIQNAAYTYSIVRAVETKGHTLYDTKKIISRDYKIGLFKGEDALVNKLFDPQHKLNSVIKEIAPTFLDVLTHQSNLNSTSYKFFGTNNFKNIDDSLLNVIHNELKALYVYDSNNNTGILESIILYDLYTSGFSYNSKSITNLIPIEFTAKFINNEDLIDVVDKDFNDFKDDFFKNNLDDPTIISTNYVNGVNNYNTNTFKKYVLVKSDYAEDSLAQFVGVNVGKKIKPIYKRIRSGKVVIGDYSIHTLGSTTVNREQLSLQGDAYDNFAVKPYVKPIDKIHHIDNTIREMNNSSTFDEVSTSNLLLENMDQSSINELLDYIKKPLGQVTKDDVVNYFEFKCKKR